MGAEYNLTGAERRPLNHNSHKITFYIAFLLGEFEECTVLFSDVVTFTNICSECEPIQIVSMLNSMYLKFDRLTTIHNVYKVSISFKDSS